AHAHAVELPAGRGAEQFAVAARRDAAQLSAHIVKLDRDIAAAVETLPVRRQREIQLARQVRPQTARVDAARASLQRPALRRRPDEAPLQTRMAVEQIGFGAAECETVLAERPVHL